MAAAAGRQSVKPDGAARAACVQRGPAPADTASPAGDPSVPAAPGGAPRPSRGVSARECARVRERERERETARTAADCVVGSGGGGCSGTHAANRESAPADRLRGGRAGRAWLVEPCGGRAALGRDTHARRPTASWSRPRDRPCAGDCCCRGPGRRSQPRSVSRAADPHHTAPQSQRENRTKRRTVSL